MASDVTSYQTIAEARDPITVVSAPSAPGPNKTASAPDRKPIAMTLDEAVDWIGFGRVQLLMGALLGLCWLAESMEVMLLSVLSPALHCDWRISAWKQAFVTTAVFVGMMVGQLFWGWFADKYGRKTTVCLAGAFVAYFGLISSFSPTYTWMLLLRGLVGFFVGSVQQAVTLYSEFLPTKHRGGCLIVLELFWAAGAALEVLLAMFVMPSLGWRWLLVLSSVPPVIFAVLSPILPESARYQAACGRSQQAEETLARVAAKNGKTLPPGQLVTDLSDVKARGHLPELLSRELRRTSLLLWTAWIAVTFCYYGIVLIATELLKMPEDQLCASVDMPEPERTCQAFCPMLTTANYIDLLWTTLAEVPGVLLAMLLIDRLGRKKTIALGLFIFIISVLVLLFCIQSRLVLTGALSVSRAMISGVFQCVIIYTPEVYPTHLRATGMGAAGAMARIGAMITPMVAQVLVHSSVPQTAAVYAAVAALGAVATLLLPYDTAGRAMVK